MDTTKQDILNSWRELRTTAVSTSRIPEGMILVDGNAIYNLNQALNVYFKQVDAE